MGEGIFGKLLGSLEAVGEKIPDKRRVGCNLKYRLLDGIKSAFGVFFFQPPSLLDFQRAMKERLKRSNMETLLGVSNIPSDNQIRTLLDGIEPESLGEEYKWLKVTLLGDDLYCKQPFCEAVLKQGMSFLFSCKPDSHRWLSETVENSYLHEKVVKKWTGSHHQTSTYRWIKGVPLRDSKDALNVKYLYLQIRKEKTGKAWYTNSWITAKEITTENVEHLAQ